jgi:hypothetical protein
MLIHEDFFYCKIYNHVLLIICAGALLCSPALPPASGLNPFAELKTKLGMMR